MKDPMIGKRAFEELTRYIYDTGSDIGKFCKEHDVCRQNVYWWYKNSTSPNAYMLQLMANLGIDVMYILTGRRSNGQTGIQNQNPPGAERLEHG